MARFSPSLLSPPPAFVELPVGAKPTRASSPPGLLPPPLLVLPPCCCTRFAPCASRSFFLTTIACTVPPRKASLCGSPFHVPPASLPAGDPSSPSAPSPSSLFSPHAPTNARLDSDTSIRQYTVATAKNDRNREPAEDRKSKNARAETLPLLRSPPPLPRLARKPASAVSRRPARHGHGCALWMALQAKAYFGLASRQPDVANPRSAARATARGDERCSPWSRARARPFRVPHPLRLGTRRLIFFFVERSRGPADAVSPGSKTATLFAIAFGALPAQPGAVRASSPRSRRGPRCGSRCHRQSCGSSRQHELHRGGRELLRFGVRCSRGLGGRHRRAQRDWRALRGRFCNSDESRRPVARDLSRPHRAGGRECVPLCGARE